MTTERSPAALVYRRASARFGPLREALARADFRAVSPPDALAEWELLDGAGTRVRIGAGFVLVEAGEWPEAERFDARFRAAFPSERDVPDGGDPPVRVALIAGSDESGKAECDRALSVAAVAMPVALEEEALARGVRDSKHCAAAEIAGLSRWIASVCAHEVRSIEPDARAEALRSHGGNESRLLAALHAECLRALHARMEFPLARVDRFAPSRPVAAALAATHEAVLVDECARAERHASAAAASILARARSLDPTAFRTVPGRCQAPPWRTRHLPGTST
ncbi:MAG: hypothetical protein ACKOYN_02350 [Planctomycetota bacterium]